MSRHRAAPTPRRFLPSIGAVTARRAAIVGGRALAATLAVALVAVTGIGWWWSGSASSSSAVDDAGDVGVVQPSGNPATSAARSAGPAPTTRHTAQATTSDVAPVGHGENILVVGVDSRTDAEGNPLTPQQQHEIGVPLDGGGVNTDTLLILHVPADGSRITGISIPRDTWMGLDVVHAPGVTGPDSSGGEVPYKPGKINSFYGSAKYYRAQYLSSQGVTGAELNRESDEAGRTMLIKIIQQFTGIKINHFAEANLLGFYLLSQAIGGVPVCLLHPVDDRRSGADFPAGEFSVEGRSALAFVRQRHGLPGGDFSRIKRQQAFLESAANKILSAGVLANPSRVTSLVDAVQRSLVLDSGFDLVTLAEQLRTLASGDMVFATLPTSIATDITSTDALRADPVQVREIFSALNDGRPLPSAATAPPTSSVLVTSPGPGATTSGSPTGSSTGTSRTLAPGPGGYQVPCVN